jgi:hypothetical protein
MGTIDIADKLRALVAELDHARPWPTSGAARQIRQETMPMRYSQNSLTAPGSTA